MLKKIILLVSAFVTLVICGEDDQFAPDFTVKDIDGNTHTLSAYSDSGKFVLLDFFSSTCGTCGIVAKSLDSVYYAYGENKKDLVVLGISVRSLDSLKDIVKFSNDNDTLDYPLASGVGGGWQIGQDYYNVKLFEGTPTFILVEPKTMKVLWYEWGWADFARVDSILKNNMNISSNNGLSSAKKYWSPIFASFVSSKIIKINVPNSSRYTIKIYDLLGRMIFSDRYFLHSGTNSITIDCSIGAYKFRFLEAVDESGKVFRTAIQ